jgi:micrococcal nuclease
VIGYKYNCILLKVIDGDTVDCEVDLGFHVHVVERFRLADINAAEMNSGDPKAKEAKSFLQVHVGSTLIVESRKSDKYGRFLGTFWFPNDPSKSINDEMIELGLAVPYGQ